MPEFMSMSSQMDPGMSMGPRGADQFPNPFLDMASTQMPQDNRTALNLCQFIYQSHETYRMAMDRIVSYFLTDLEFSSASPGKSLGDDEKDKWRSCLTESLATVTELKSAGHNRACYGNDFISLVVPFRRYLMCPKCKRIRVPLKVAYENPDFRFEFTDYDFIATCPRTECGHRGKWIVDDETEATPERLRLKHWPPQQMHIINDPITGESRYLWQIPGDYKRLISNKSLFHLERAPLGVLNAIKHNQLFAFDPDVIYHMKEPTLAGVFNRGWGISRLITNFRQMWYVQVLRRYNEAIALDYVIPFRLITPEARTGSGAAGGVTLDPLLTTNMGDYMSMVRAMIRRRRRDPAGWFTLPFPVKYQALGGDAANLAPAELLNQGMDILLNGAGVPTELYKGTLQLQAAPVSLRLFEATWFHLVHDYNDCLRWLIRRVSATLRWELVGCKLRRVTYSDDAQLQMALLQLMMGQTISQTTALSTLGLDRKEELRRKAEEARDEQEMQAEVQEEMDQSAFGQQISKGMPPGQGQQPGQPMDPAQQGQQGQAPGGQPGMAGQPGPVSSMITGGNTPQTPEDMMSTAQSLAQELLGLPESQKDSELRALKQKNEVLHSLVTAQLKNIRSQASSQGRSLLMNQQFPKQ